MDETITPEVMLERAVNNKQAIVDCINTINKERRYLESAGFDTTFYCDVSKEMHDYAISQGIDIFLRKCNGMGRIFFHEIN